MSRRNMILSFVVGTLSLMAAQAKAQSPGVIYTWDATGLGPTSTEQWFRNFGAASTAATFSVNPAGSLSIAETSTALGGSQAFSDDFNRIRESSVSGNGGLDLTGLQFLEFDMGHNGVNPVNVQFFTQATPGATFVALGPDIAITPGVNTYQVPLTGLTPDQQVYMRTIGFNIRDHAAEGNLTWQVAEVRSAGTPLAQRNLATFDNGSAEGGLQGLIVNFDGASVAGNSGQNQTGLSHNAAGSGSVQWTDVAGGNGAAVSLGNGTAFAGNTFNNRETDLSNYTSMLVRISATDAGGGGGEIAFNTFFQANNFAIFENPEGGATKSIPIDGQFHDVVFDLTGLTNMNAVDQTGINLVAHPQQLTMNIDLIQFNGPVPEPTTLLGLSAAAVIVGLRRRR
jgi:hypothetical protein